MNESSGSDSNEYDTQQIRSLLMSSRYQLQRQNEPQAQPAPSQGTFAVQEQATFEIVDTQGVPIML